MKHLFKHKKKPAKLADKTENNLNSVSEFLLSDLLLGGIVVLIVIIFKLYFSRADTDSLKFLLVPVNFFIELITGSKGNYIMQKGFYHERFNIIIDKSCSGGNLLIIAFTVFSYALITSVSKTRLKCTAIFKAAVISYFFCITVNTFRIFSLLMLQKYNPFYLFPLHEVVGIFVNLFFLVSVYFLLIHLLKRNN